MKRVFLVSLDGLGVAGEHHIIGFISSNNRELIANFIKEQYGLILQDQLHNMFDFQNDIHWEYSTNRLDIDVHVDIYYNLDENEDE